MGKDNIFILKKEKKFTKEGELMERLGLLIDEYAGELSLVSVIGILDLKKQCITANETQGY